MAHIRKLAMFLSVAALIAVVGAACGGGEAASTGEPTSEEVPAAQWEAVLLAETATTFRSHGQEVLRLDGVNPTLTAFTDRPDRMSGELDLFELLALWHMGLFEGDPPNAAVVVGSEVAAMELTGAVWHLEGESLWVSIDRLPSVDAGGEQNDWSAPIPEGSPVQVFIDGFTETVSPQVTDSVTQSNVKVIGEAPAQAMGVVYQSMAESQSLAFQNAADAPDSLTQVDTAATNQAVGRILAQR